jgi:UDP-N-acetylmuramyl pentapeptide phosphotransferase/UDP-N-acetylglucosamine-1-phosphate transferase
MHFLGVNLWAVLVCAVATMVLGFLWYSPALFANPWMKLMGYDPNDKAKIAEMQKSAGPSYFMSMIASLLAAFVLGKLIAVAGFLTAIDGLKIGLVVWLGFVTTVQFTNALFSRQPFRLYMINTGYQFLCYAVMGAILGAWR